MTDTDALAVEARREASEGDQPNKALLTRIADYLDRIAAPEGVGLTRYGSPAFIPDDPGCEWVRHEDAAAAVAAKDAEIEKIKASGRYLISDASKAAIEVGAERDALKAALEKARHELWRPVPHGFVSNAQTACEIIDAALSKTQGGG